MLSKLHRKLVAALLGFIILSGLSARVVAEELRIGMATAPTTLDPHDSNIGYNIAIAQMIYNAIGDFETMEQFNKPTLLLSKKRLKDDGSLWEYRLRQGVKFHDGVELKASDVVYSINRVKSKTDGVATFKQYVSEIKSIKAIGDYILHIEVTAHYNERELYDNLVKIKILPEHLKHLATPENFINGIAATGTNAYQLVSITPGKRIKLKRFENYWQADKTSNWDSVILDFIEDDQARFQALLDGKVDIAEQLSPDKIVALKAAGFRSLRRISSRIIFFQMDSYRNSTPFITDKQGNQLKANPLKSLLVRQALSKAIDRQKIVEVGLHTGGEAAGQLFHSSSQYASKNLAVDSYDSKQAKKLLAEAGYPDGFKLTIHGPAGRYTNDVEVLKLIAAMFSDIGIETTAVSLPTHEYFTRALNDHEFSLSLLGWVPSSKASYTFHGLLYSQGKTADKGEYNVGRYSNLRLDTLIDRASYTRNATRSQQLYRMASDLAIRDQAIIPLHFQMRVWGLRDDLRFEPTERVEYTRPEFVFNR